jgi:hypothetical protein
MPQYFARGKYHDEDTEIAPYLGDIEEVYEVLVKLTEPCCPIQFQPDEDLDHAFEKRDEPAARFHIIDTSFKLLAFFVFTTAYKARLLMSSLLDAYNSDNLLAWCILGRSMVEYAAITHYFASKLNLPGLQGPRFALRDLQDLRDSMTLYVNGTRFNWHDLLAGNIKRVTKHYEVGEESQAINVLTAVKHLSRRDERYGSFLAAYSILSDFAHPNMGSHATVCKTPDMTTRTNVLTWQPGAERGEFIMAYSLRFISLSSVTIAEIIGEMTDTVQSLERHALSEATHVIIDYQP